MKRGEIRHVNLILIRGSGQAGRRYALIVSADDRNKAARLAVVCPITTGGEWARARGFAVPLTTAGTQPTEVILVHQVRTVDLIARKAALGRDDRDVRGGRDGLARVPDAHPLKDSAAAS